MACAGMGICVGWSGWHGPTHQTQCNAGLQAEEEKEREKERERAPKKITRRRREVRYRRIKSHADRTKGEQKENGARETKRGCRMRAE